MKNSTYLLLLALLLSACQGDDTDESAPRAGAGLLPIALRIPASDGYGTRAAGDPGDYSNTISLPTTLYVYVVTEKADGETHLTDSIVSLTPARWQHTTTDGASYYEYTGAVRVELPSDIALDDRQAIRVYAAATPVPFATVDDVQATTPEATLRDITFSLQADDGGSYDYIRDVYATMADHTVGGEYYGTAQNPTTATPSVSLTLYHVAAKVDVIWNVATAMQQEVKLKQLQLRHLRKTGCRLFRPMQNTPTTTDTYQETVTTDVGSQWLGRHSFYMMPCLQAGALPLEFHLWQDDDNSADGYTQHISISTTETTFTPWVRQDILISKTLK